MKISSGLVASELFSDPRFQQAKQQMLEVVREHSEKLTEVKLPDPARKKPYDELIANFAEARGGKLWFPYIGSGVGNGVFVELSDGSVKYDCICGIGPHFFGHSHPMLMEAAMDAAITDTIMQGNLQQNNDSLVLTNALLSASGLDHCFLSTSGAMANENALKIAFQYKSPAGRILAFDKCFLGRTLIESQVTDKPAFRQGLPLTHHIDYLPFYDPAQPELSKQQALDALKKYLQRYPKQHAVMIIELVQGEAGFYYASKDFFLPLIQLAKEHEIIILFDEVQTFARTPQLFAFQHFELEEFADIVTIGKISQVCATLFRTEYKPLPGLLSQTFTGSTASIKAAIAILDALLTGGYYGTNGKIQKVYDYFSQKLNHIAIKFPNAIHGPYGIGSMIAFTPFDGDFLRAAKITQDLFEAGVMTFIAGTNPTRIRFLLPAGVIQESDMDAIALILEQVLAKESL